MITIASAFWRNDQPDGIGVMVNRDDFQDLDNAIAIALEMYARKKGHDFDFYFRYKNPKSIVKIDLQMHSVELNMFRMSST